jgi:hypothetical protein
MIGRLSVTFVLLAVPAFGQSRVYTNADLGKVQRTHTATEEELAGLRAHQFMAIPDRPAGPEVIVGSGSPNEGPFGPFSMTPNEPLGMQMPVGLPVFSGGYGYGYRTPRHVTVTAPNLLSPPNLLAGAPSLVIPATVPPSVHASSPAGHRGRRR